MCGVLRTFTEFDNKKMNTPGKILEKARNQRGLILKKVAKDTGISMTTIHTWERGASLPSPKNRKIIAKYFNLPETVLMKADGDGNSPSLLVNYETRPIMLHKDRWVSAEALLKEFDVLDMSALFDRLVSEAKQAKNG